TAVLGYYVAYDRVFHFILSLEALLYSLLCCSYLRRFDVVAVHALPELRPYDKLAHRHLTFAQVSYYFLHYVCSLLGISFLKYYLKHFSLRVARYPGPVSSDKLEAAYLDLPG